MMKTQQKAHKNTTKRFKNMATRAHSHDAKKPQFTDPAVQDVLSRITGLELQKVFRPIKRELKLPSYKLMTDEQLNQAINNASEQAKKLLQMPLVLPERKPIDDVLSEDPFLAGMDTAKYVFTDITYNVPHRLFKCFQKFGDVGERDRLVQVYFPKEGRKLTPYHIFKEENLKMVFSMDRHEDVLDLCLVQFEPDSSDYIKVHMSTYEDLDKHGKYDLLRSTRHFGGLAWYLVNARRVDGLIVDMLKRDLLQDAVSLVSLFHMVHPHSESAQEAALQQATGADLLKVRLGFPYNKSTYTIVFF
uniref:Mitochondrial ribosomal protein S22 n=1 Tax=Neogobius melanostomus TaxID=47308 RepID=A0A8C6UJD8_9GOBI